MNQKHRATIASELDLEPAGISSTALPATA